MSKNSPTLAAHVRCLSVHQSLPPFFILITTITRDTFLPLFLFSRCAIGVHEQIWRLQPIFYARRTKANDIAFNSWTWTHYWAIGLGEWNYSCLPIPSWPLSYWSEEVRRKNSWRKRRKWPVTPHNIIIFCFWNFYWIVSLLLCVY